MARKKTNPHVGSDFDDFLLEEGRLQESTALAIKRVLAWEIERVMKETNVSQAELARRMKTSRAVVHRLLDATDPSVTLATISKAATALGRSVRVALAAQGRAGDMEAQAGTRVLMKPERSHEDATIESFAKEPEYAAAYLTAVLEDGDAAELRVALTRIVRASGGGLGETGD